MYTSINLHPSEFGVISVLADSNGPYLAVNCGDVTIHIMLPLTDTPAGALPFARALHAATGEFLAAAEQHAIAHLDPETGPDPMAA
ncbi:hypothetical protein [Streptacidiphilus carbonis]|uniref:hypothetical protein n=1 Tax=Streptacidiphilus carbonis TaxID=105422 RepID=UPI0005A80F66|nr:hypothetical protein [Streptacidiphilus carbonis]